MTREELIRNLKYTMRKHKNDKVYTFETNISLMCKDILDYLERESSEDCVSRKAMLDAISEIDDNINMDIYTNEVREIIRELPPVTPVCKKGKWIKVTETDFGIGYKCSECGRFILTESIDEKRLKDFPYCHCGAKMEVEE